jgi:exodeoxyribonuclease VII small subunit
MTKDTKKSEKNLTFEEALESLENISNRLESGELGLDDSIAEFEKGMRLARLCQRKIEDAERKIEILQKGKEGEIREARVKVDRETGEIEDDENLQGSLL